MLTDALDGTLSAADQAAFDLHIQSCVTCAGMLADAQRGAAWLEMLKSSSPEPPATLVDRILAHTSAHASEAVTPLIAAAAIAPAASNTLLGGPVLLPAFGSVGTAQPASNILPFRRLAASFNLRQIGHTLLQPRLSMTAAMAFFSLALTLNLTGVKLNELRLSDLRPSSLKRSFSQANAHVVRYYDNLRVVYELESRVHDLQSSSESDNNSPDNSAPAKQAPQAPDSKPSGNPQPNQPAGQPSNQPSSQPDQQDQNKQNKPRPHSGTSRREDPSNTLRYAVADSDSDSDAPSRSTGSLQIPSPVSLATLTFATLFPSVAPCIKNSPIIRSMKEGKLV
jgi:hypothetical protein